MTKTLTKQALFDKVAKALLKQGKASVNANGTCAYRGEDKCRCAIGHLIPNSRYRTELEGWGASNEKVQGAANLPIHLVGLARALQIAHDGHLTRNVPDWITAMKVIAKDWSLSDEVLP